jgi:hypothetical protein
MATMHDDVLLFVLIRISWRPTTTGTSRKKKHMNDQNGGNREVQFPV